MLMVAAVAFLMALLIGATEIEPQAAWGALWGAGDPQSVAVIQAVRLPRAVAALLVGIALGGGGAVMQVITLNPLAGPGIMGLNGGGALAVLALMIAAPGAGLVQMALASLGGAALSAIMVLAVARRLRGGMSPLGLTLVGAALAMLQGAVASGIVLAKAMQNDMLYWTVGGLGTVGWSAVWLLIVAVGVGGVIAVAIAPALTVMLLGDDVATALGPRIQQIRALGIAAVVIGAGGASAVAGPVAFVGLMAPHGARSWLGHDQRLVIPGAALLGGAAVLIADTVGRVASPPSEIPLGVFLSLIGAPLLVGLMVRSRISGALT